MSCKVGDSMVRVDGLSKVTGQAIYAADISMSGMLYGKVLGSPHAHARIKAVRLEKARRLPGVRAAVCYNIKAARLSRQHNDSNVLVLGAAFMKGSEASRIVGVWLKSRFLGGRHKRRLNQIKKIEKHISFFNSRFSILDSRKRGKKVQKLLFS